MTYSLFVGAGKWQAAANETATQGFFGLDADAQWQPLSNGLPDQVEVRSIVLHPDRPDTIYAGTQRGPYRSKDAGESWHSLTLPEGTPDEDRVVWSICLDPSDPETIYVGTQNTAVFRSRNGGQGFERLAIPEPEGVVCASFAMRVIRIAVAADDPNHILVAFEIGGLVRSRDGGNSAGYVAAWDTNGDGKIDWSELVAASHQPFPPPQRRASLAGRTTTARRGSTPGGGGARARHGVAARRSSWAGGGDIGASVNVDLYETAVVNLDKNKNGSFEADEVPEGHPFHRRFLQLDRAKTGSITQQEYEYYKGLFDAARNVVLAVRPGGKDDITESHVLWQSRKLVPFCSSPLYMNGLLFTIKDKGTVSYTHLTLPTILLV